MPERYRAMIWFFLVTLCARGSPLMSCCAPPLNMLSLYTSALSALHAESSNFCAMYRACTRPTSPSQNHQTRDASAVLHVARDEGGAGRSVGTSRWRSNAGKATIPAPARWRGLQPGGARRMRALARTSATVAGAGQTPPHGVG